MTVLSGQTVRELGLISPCVDRRDYPYLDKTLTYGLGPAGYDVTLDWGTMDGEWIIQPGQFRLAATIERFCLPDNVTGFVMDKSSWARRGLNLFNTILEPEWRGYLTLELINHGPTPLYLPQGIPIAQVVFHYLDHPTIFPYSGKYQDQASGPQSAR